MYNLQLTDCRSTSCYFVDYVQRLQILLSTTASKFVESNTVKFFENGDLSENSESKTYF